jgi:flagellar basal-body rod protein FlgB
MAKRYEVTANVFTRFALPLPLTTFEAQRLQSVPPEVVSMSLPGLDSITSLLGSFLDVQSRRAEVVAGNLANADTPGYVAKELDFADFLKTATSQTFAPTATGSANAGSLLSAPRVVDQQATTIGMDGNTVDSNREMSTLAESGMKYLEGTQLLEMRLRTLRTAIREGK